MQSPYRDDWITERSEWTHAHLEEPPIFNPDYALATGQRTRSTQPNVVEIKRDAWLQTQYSLIPSELLSGKDLPPLIPIPIWFTLLTSLFLHGGILHLLGNMLYLWIFGDNVEDAMGPVRFLGFYILCGIAAALAQIAIGPSSSIPMLGASGAIAGVLAAYFMLYPQSRVLTLIPLFFFLRIVAVPAVFLLGFWFLLQVVSGARSVGSSGGVAFFAHIGGFLAGLFLVFPFRQRHVPVTLWRIIQRRHAARR
ncbi:rhomboid family intramembrane serine protease [Candidatus Bipolaricaulota bacterium]|nr:rhomboid family intramembrane serine protease [Candidatus Bipolaricaulota bacterium]TFH07879.1 MAG: rhomboid family intramembrane serine protease [Candidatus Atribacteria bacterium]